MRFFRSMPIIGFFSAFYSPLGMISYICGLGSRGFRFSLADSLFLIFLFFILSYHLLVSNIVFSLLTFRFYFGFFIFYMYFKSNGYLPVRKLLFLIIILIPLEALLINTVISPVSMPNFPDAEAYSHFNPGGYQRPYSFAGNASVTSSLLIALASLFPLTLLSVSVLFPLTAMLASGSGFLSLLIYILANNLRLFLLLLLMFSPLFLSLFQYAVDYIDSFGVKFNSEYIAFLISFKLEQIADLFNGYTLIDYLLGNLRKQESGGYGGDFGWLYFVLSYGFLSLLFLVAFILTKLSRHNAIALTVLLLSTFHYPVIFFLPGQIILAYVMTVGKQNNI